MYNFQQLQSTPLDLTRLVPYGDTMNDGKIQVIFTLPVSDCSQSTLAATQLAEKMGLEDVVIAHHVALSSQFTMYILEGKLTHSVDYTKIPQGDSIASSLSRDDIDLLVETSLHRPLVVVGASIGNDAHTVGIDAILNRKGFGGHAGLESYRMLKVYNLGGQVPPEELAEQSRKLHADIVLASQTVTQCNIHLYNLRVLRELIPSDVTLACGGPRITNKIAKELGYARGFGAGTLPSEVAEFVVTHYLKYHCSLQMELQN